MALVLLAAAGHNSRSHRVHQSTTEALAPVVQVSAHRADLCPTGRTQALSGHGNEHALSSDSEVVAELNRAREEWSGLRALDEFQHLGYVSRTQAHDVGIGLTLKIAAR